MRAFRRRAHEPTPVDPQLSKWQVHRATRTRSTFIFISSFFLFCAMVFLIIVEIANIADKAVLRDIYFIKLDLSNVIPEGVPNGVLLTSIAQTIGLYDFYQVGLWNYCEGYNGEGIQQCSETTTRFWFNPVGIIVSQLIAGATIRLPEDISDILNIIRIASHWMFGLFLTSACLSTVLIPVVYLSVRSRWWAVFTTIFTFVNALAVTAAAVIGTVMFIVMRNVFQNSIQEVNIRANIGNSMFACMWIASAFAIFAFLIHLGQTCCCASRRDVRSGRKRGSRAAYSTGNYSDESTNEKETSKVAGKQHFWQRNRG